MQTSCKPTMMKYNLILPEGDSLGSKMQKDALKKGLTQQLPKDSPRGLFFLRGEDIHGGIIYVGRGEGHTDWR